MFVWVEWICAHCNVLHRTKFEIDFSYQAKNQLSTDQAWKYDESISIRDVASKIKPKKRGRSANKIFVDVNTPIPLIIDAVKTYMCTFYSSKDQNFKVEICNE